MPTAPPPLAPRQSVSRLRWRFAFAALCCVPLGLATKRSGLFPVEWIANSLGGALYVLLGVMITGAIAPRAVGRTPRRRVLVAGGVALLTCAVEFSQLWQFELLERARATGAGRLILGTTFAWSDFPGYLVGAILGWGLLRMLGGLSPTLPPPPA